MVDACGVERARAADDSVDLVAFVKKKIGEVGSVLSGDACDECFFHAGFEVAEEWICGKSMASEYRQALPNKNPIRGV